MCETKFSFAKKVLFADRHDHLTCHVINNMAVSHAANQSTNYYRTIAHLSVVFITKMSKWWLF